MLILGPFTFTGLRGRRYEWRRQQDQRPRVYLLGEKPEELREQASLYKNLPTDKRPQSAWFERKPLEVLGCLLSKPNTELSRAEIEAIVWPDGVQTRKKPGTHTGATPDDTAVQKYVGYIRRLLLDELDSDGKSKIIRATGKRSYKFLLPVDPPPTTGPVGDRAAEPTAKVDRLALNGSYFLYHKTSRSGQRFWQLSDLTSSDNAAVAVPRFRDEKEPVPFELRAQRMGSALLLFGGEAPAENGALEFYAVFPHFGRSMQKSVKTPAHGLAFHFDYDDHPEFTPCLISRRPLHKEKIDSGPVYSRADRDELDKKWRINSTPINIGDVSISTQLERRRAR